MKSGDLDRRITIERATYSTNEFNEQVATWSTLLTAWASKKDVSDSERIAAQQVAAIITTRFQIRWSIKAATISPVDRIRFEDRIYDIFSSKEIGRREGVEITATARAEIEA